MTIMQLNKLQIKAEILTVLSLLQTNIEVLNSDAIFETLMLQEDKKSILEILIKELAKANEKKAILICFLLVKLCDEKQVEVELWNMLKTPSVSDVSKMIALNLLKDMGNKVEYKKINEYFENPDEVIDADTKKLLHVAIINPEAQIDFLDFVNTLESLDKKLLIESLGEDYSSDDLANILNPLFLYAPNSDIGKIVVEILGSTKSQLALHSLSEALEFVDEEDTISLIKRNISKLKIAGVRKDNSMEFYKSILSSKPYYSYISYPDGHGNQAIIFSREKENETIQIVAIVINDVYGLVDCFGFNEISKKEFERIVDRFYNGDEHVCVDFVFVKNMLLHSEKMARLHGDKISYEYICWKTLLSDIEVEVTPIELLLSAKFTREKLSEEGLEKIYMLDFVQRWFFDTDYDDNFRCMIEFLNSKIKLNDFTFEFEDLIEEYLDKIFTIKQKDILNQRLLLSSYLKYLSKDRKESKEEAKLLYRLYFDEYKKNQLAKNIIRKSIYEYYVSLKFKYKDRHKMMNIFAMKNKSKSIELTPRQIDLTISLIESLWVN